MVSSSNINRRILDLRRKRKSYGQIAATLNVAKSTVSYWLSKNPESRLIKEILTKQNREKSRQRIIHLAALSKKRWQQWRAVAQKEAAMQFPALIRNPYFIAGIMLYWGEGDSKPRNPLRLSNTDPRMIRCFLYFLLSILKVPKEKIRLGLILYPDLSDRTCKNFWKKTTKLNEDNFMKTQFIKGHHPTKRLSHGICMVVVNSRQQKIRVLTWIDIFSKQSTI